MTKIALQGIGPGPAEEAGVESEIRFAIAGVKFVPCDLTRLAKDGLFDRLFSDAAEEQEDSAVRIGNNSESTHAGNIFRLAVNGSTRGFDMPGLASTSSTPI